MSVNSGTTAVINALTISNGSTFEGGGIYISGTLTITDSTLKDNTARLRRRHLIMTAAR